MNGPNVVCGACGTPIPVLPVSEFKPFCDDCMAQVAQFMPEPREHELSMDCWCKPVRDAEEPSVVVHNEEAK